MALTSKLDAVNAIIGVVGEAPLNTLENTAFTSDATVAVRLLDQVSREVQTLGWSFNTDRDFPLSKDGSGHIFVPSNLLRIAFDRHCNVNPYPVLRGRQMYDRKNQTFVFSKDLKAQQVVWELDWDDLPESCRHYIVVRTSRLFADRQGGGGEVHAYTEMQEVEAKRDFERDQSEDRKLNIFSAPGVAQIVNRSVPWVS